MNMVWLASYPRSGNTYLRTLLWHCMGLKSASVYPNDLEKRKELEDYVGHIEQVDRKIRFPQGVLPLIKTHERPLNDAPAIYIVRDGRAASVSLWHFFEKEISLEQVIEGDHHFGTWSDHIAMWDPENRPNTLLIRYEDLLNELESTLIKVGNFLGREIKSLEVPSRNEIATSDGVWVRKASDWREQMPKTTLTEFNNKNKNLLTLYGYKL